MKSVMNHNFSRVPAPQIQRSLFDRSCGYKTTFDAGYLIPFFLDEILPGDTMKLRATMFGRLATMVFPIMDNVFLDCFFFYVPNRLLWNNWEKFNGAQANPDDSTDFLIPQMGMGGAQFPLGSLGDYFGLPVGANIAAADDPNSLPFRAYNLIFNEWFRDQNLQDSETVDLDDGPDALADYQLLKRGKRHDYFTSCLPWPQKGDSVQLPLGLTAPVIGTGIAIGLTDGTVGYGTGTVITPDNGNFSLKIDPDSEAIPVGTTFPVGTPAGTGPSKVVGLTTNPDNSGMVADLTAATAATINQLRQAFAFQKILERDARGGTRYVELLKAHFGVTSPDFRLQRPEYLGGSSQRVDVRTVPQTSSTVEAGALGQLAAYGTVGGKGGFNKSFVEHGYIIGLVNLRSDITYQQKMDRMWSRSTRFDFYLPALAHLGEQAVLNKELFYAPSGTAGNEVWGYQERWAEYRYKPSQVTGLFRSAVANSLDSWHLATHFSAQPVLNDAFIQDQPPIDRVIAVPSEPHLILDTYFSIKHARPMPVYSVPGQIDRF